MVETINVPGVGATNKTTVYYAVGGVVVLGGIVYYRHKKNAATAAASVPVDSTQIDPSTGFPYGSSQDAAALTQAAQYTNPALYGGIAAGGSTQALTPIGTTVAPQTNPAWTQAAVDFLANTVGLSSSTVSAALGRYVTGEPVSSADKSLIEQAIAAMGYPPQPGPFGFPPHIKDAPSGTPPGPLPGPSGTPAVHLSAPHLAIGSLAAKTALIKWSPVPLANGYHIFRNGVGIGTRPASVTQVTVNRPGSFTVTALGIPGKSYTSAQSNAVKA